VAAGDTTWRKFGREQHEALLPRLGSRAKMTDVGLQQSSGLPFAASLPTIASTNPGVPSLDHKGKVAFLLKDFEQRGISRYTTAPPLLWRLGIEVPPPHFASFNSIAQLVGVSSRCSSDCSCVCSHCSWPGRRPD
jgi:Family of unknown function (DUF6404)